MQETVGCQACQRRRQGRDVRLLLPLHLTLEMRAAEKSRYPSVRCDTFHFSRA
jgi:hypothetical protein